MITDKLPWTGMGRGKHGSDSKKSTGGRGGQPYQVGGNVIRGEENVLQYLSKKKLCRKRCQQAQ